MKLDRVVKILGQTWRVKICSMETEPRLKTLSGFTDRTSHFIGIIDPDEKECNLDNPVALVKEIMRHEVIHAYMFESGLGDSWEHSQYGQDETIVDWIALQFDKMWVTIKDLEKAIEVEIECEKAKEG